MLYGPTETAYIVMYGDNYLSDSETWVCLEEADAHELVLSLWEEYLYEQYCYESLCFPRDYDAKDFWEYYRNHYWDYDYFIQCVKMPLY